MPKSNAFSGVGTKLRRALQDSTSAPTFEDIAEINNISGPNKSRDIIDVTSLDSLGGYREFIPGFRDGGELTQEMNFTDTGYINMNDDFESEETKDYQLALPNAEQTVFDFEGYVTSLGTAIPMDDKVTANVTIKITGQITMSSTPVV